MNPLAPRPNHTTPKAKACIFIFMEGGPSQMDLFDPKPMLNKLNGQPLPDSLTKDMRFAFIQNETATVLGSNQQFKKYGESGMDFSELVPNMAGVADDITMIRSMHTGVNNHGQSIYALRNGTALGGRPTLGSWLTYGLGSENRNLPAFVALTDPRGLPVLGVDNFSNGWLPSLYQDRSTCRFAHTAQNTKPAHMGMGYV